jgi:hypothetical protein
VDCLAPVISNVTTTNVAAQQATVTFATDESSSAQVRYGTACASLAHTQAGAGAGTTHQIVLSGLSPMTQYFFAVDATDTAGNLATDDNAGACYSFTTPEQPDYFTELFDAGDNDLSNQTLTFTPDGSADFYQACRTVAAAFPTHPRGGTPLVLGDDDYALVALTGGAQVSLYGVPYNSFFVGSNGYITFGVPDTTPGESFAAHFSLPRVSALFDDLYPPGGGTILWKQLPDRVAVTFENIPEYGTDDSNSFQIELFFDGRIRLTYLALAAAEGLAGLSQGLGVPADFIESDLSAYECQAPVVHDSVVLPVAPKTLTIAAGETEVTAKLSVKVRSADILPAKERPGHTIELTVPATDCPAGTIAGAPDFDAKTPGAQSTVLLAGGTTKTAVVPLYVSSAAFTTFNRKAPNRCTVTLQAATIDPPGSVDPTPENNSVTVELNIIDKNDPELTATHESVLKSRKPVTVTLAKGKSTVAKNVTLSVVNADYLPTPENPGHDITVEVQPGDCPSGALGDADFDSRTAGAQHTVTVKGGATKSGTVQLTINAAAFATTNGRSPTRCTAIVTAVGPTQPDPEPTNNRTRLVIDVVDKNDF